MAELARWEMRELRCPEGECVAHLLVEWHDTQGKPTLSGVYCDHPRFRDLDNWDCRGSCWEVIAAEREVR